MASPRFFADAATETACYHCVSRVVGRQRVLDDEARDEFVRMLRAYEGFCQVRILGYVVMSDHFHVMVEVKARPEGEAAKALTDDWLIKQLRQIYAKPYVDTFIAVLREYRSAGRKGAEEAEAFREKHLARMWKVSQFMKEFKQRYSLWFNKRIGRRGTLWEERFTSVLVEDSPHPQSLLSAYMDLNPVRAGLVDHPGAYPWCQYAAAKKGDRKALSALAKVTGQPSAAKALRAYEELLAPAEEEPTAGPKRKSKDNASGEGDESNGGGHAALEGKSARIGRPPHPKAPKLSLQEGLRHQVRYFSRGVAVGSEAFLEEFFQNHRERFQTARKSGARPMKEVDFGDIKSMRGLRTGVVKNPS
jgi:hypothetical protein